jgi:hypothetical protein
MRNWSEKECNQANLQLNECQVVVWFHDESTFYVNDWWKTQWVHCNKTAKPYAKGEGLSQMVADFVSADYSWLSSPDGKEHAWVLFKAGKNCEGYFTNEDIFAQAEKAMDILEKHYSNKDNILVFDNAKLTSNELMMCFLLTTCRKHLPLASRRILIFGLTKKALMGSWFMALMEKY